MQRKILIAEDNIEISDVERNFLLKAGHIVYQAFDGQQALEMVKRLQPDLLLLDIMMPIVDGYEVCEKVRECGRDIPIIVISAKVSEDDKIRLFELGADDYITKPFSNAEMVCRVNAQLRRYYDYAKPSLSERRYGDLVIYPNRFEVKVKGEVINLTAKEFKILDTLTMEPNRIFSKQKLIDIVWGFDDYIDDNTVAVTIARLRNKLMAVNVENVITVWGLGYKWQDIK